MTRAAVMGTGSWGTAFAMVLADSGTAVTCWARDSSIAAAVNETHENPRFHPGVRLPASVRATTEPAEALDGADLAVLALPSQVLRANLVQWSPSVPRDAVYVSLLKGLEVGTMLRMSEVVRQVTGAPGEAVAVVSGPNLAREIAARQPAASVVACADEGVARRLQDACTAPYFRPYTNNDVVGVELSGVVKNVIALAVGVLDGLGLGDNAKASLMTRGLAETIRLGRALGARVETFAGLAGLGDLVATCASPLSRNHMLGQQIGLGHSIEEAIELIGQTAEGVKSCQPLLELARRHGVDMPVTEHVVSLIYEGVSPQEVIRRTMARETKPEH